MAERPTLLPLTKPAADLSLTLDRPTLEYIGYREFTLGSMVVPSSEVMNRRLGDVVPEVADVFERNVWHATVSGESTEFDYVLRGYDSHAHVTVQAQRVSILIQRLKHGRH